MSLESNPSKELSGRSNSSINVLRRSSDAVKSISRELHILLNDAETHIISLNSILNHKAKDMEFFTDIALDEFNEFIHESTVIVEGLSKRLHDVDKKSHQLIDSSKVKAHLARLEFDESLEKLTLHLDQFKSNIGAHLKQSEHSTANRLNTLSLKVQNLINELKT